MKEIERRNDTNKTLLFYRTYDTVKEKNMAVKNPDEAFHTARKEHFRVYGPVGEGACADEDRCRMEETVYDA